MKTLIIGQAPAKDTVGKPAFSGKSGPKFADLLGVPHHELWDHFDVVNLIDYYPGPPNDMTKRGDGFPTKEARARADGMRVLLRDRRIVLVGKNVARAFRFDDAQFFGWYRDFNVWFDYCVVPHPSGISHFWNDPANVERAREFMRAIPR